MAGRILAWNLRKRQKKSGLGRDFAVVKRQDARLELGAKGRAVGIRQAASQRH